MDSISYRTGCLAWEGDSLPAIAPLAGGATGFETEPRALSFAARSFILSWEAGWPEGYAYVFSLSVMVHSRWTRWYRMGSWSATPALRTSFKGEKDELGSVSVDTLDLIDGASALRLRVELAGGERGGGVDGASAWDTLGAAAPSRVFLSYSDPKPSAAWLSRRAATPPHEAIRLEGLPAWSQMTVPDIGRLICSPSCVAMVLAYWGRGLAKEKLEAIRAAAAGVYDASFEAYGNWSFSCAYAASRGLRAEARRFASLAELRPYLAAGVPAILSVSWDNEGGRILGGAPLSKSAGHLTLLVGFDGEGGALMHEPASPDDESVPRRYDAAELEVRWLGSSGGLAYIIYPIGTAVLG
jgi:hypothetical protein